MGCILPHPFHFYRRCAWKLAKICSSATPQKITLPTSIEKLIPAAHYSAKLVSQHTIRIGPPRIGIIYSNMIPIFSENIEKSNTWALLRRYCQLCGRNNCTKYTRQRIRSHAVCVRRLSFQLPTDASVISFDLLQSAHSWTDPLVSISASSTRVHRHE